jgi:hypothetical protein
MGLLSSSASRRCPPQSRKPWCGVPWHLDCRHTTGVQGASCPWRGCPDSLLNDGGVMLKHSLLM